MPPVVMTVSTSDPVACHRTNGFKNTFSVGWGGEEVHFSPSVSLLHPFQPRRSVPLVRRLLREVEVHFIVYVLALRIEPLQDLCQHVDSLLTAQPCALGLELLQQVFGGHRFTDQVTPDRFLR